MLEQIKAKAERFKEPVIGSMGLSFKANVDDLRELATLDIVRKLIAKDVGCAMACEPNDDKVKEFPLYDLDEVLTEVDIVVLLVAHDEFNGVSRDMLKEKIVIDTRGGWR